MDRGTATQLACLERPETLLPAATLLRPGDNCAAVARAERVTPIIDAAAYFDAFASAAERAQRSILILAWDFDSRTPLYMETFGRGQQTLGELLNRLAATRRQLRIRILDWDYPMIYGTDREFPPIYGLAWKPHRRIDFRFDATHPVAGSHHQKIVVIDDRLAFVGGLDLTNRRWDTPRHKADDPRRTFNGERYPPFHDVMVASTARRRRLLPAWRGSVGTPPPDNGLHRLKSPAIRGRHSFASRSQMPRSASPAPHRPLASLPACITSNRSIST